MIFNPFVFATPAASWLVSQNFETEITGYDNGEAWVESGTVDPAYTSVVLVGGQSLHINLAGAAGSTYVEFADQTVIYAKMKFRVALTNGGNQVIATIRNGATVLATFQMAGANRVLRATATGGSNGTSSDVLPVDTDVFVWLEYAVGSGSNSIARIGWATTDTKPNMASTGGKVGVSNGTNTSLINRLYLGNTGSGTMEVYYDAVQASDAAF